MALICLSINSIFLAAIKGRDKHNTILIRILYRTNHIPAWEDLSIFLTSSFLSFVFCVVPGMLQRELRPLLKPWLRGWPTTITSQWGAVLHPAVQSKKEKYSPLAKMACISEQWAGSEQPFFSPRRRSLLVCCLFRQLCIPLVLLLGLFSLRFGEQ